MSLTVRDLEKPGFHTGVIKAEYCIIGAGAAGIYLALKLALLGRDVVLVEASSGFGILPAEIGFVPNFIRDFYPGAIYGRAFGLGGSTSRWGGLLAPHSRCDTASSKEEPERIVWERIAGVVADNSTTVLETLGMQGQSDFQSFTRESLKRDHQHITSAGFELQASLFLPVRKKNIFHLLESKRLRHKQVQIIVNAVAKDWELRSDGSDLPGIASVTATSPTGSNVKIEAKKFIVAAGAIESARILLEIRSQHGKSVPISDLVGKFLGDHLSVPIADVAENDRKAFIDRFSPRFQGAWMRSFRFLDSEPSVHLPRSFAHFIFDNQNPGFLLAKAVLGSLQARKMPQITLKQSLVGLIGVNRLAFDRFLRSRLYIPSNTKAHLQLDVEQLPRAENSITLSEQKDRFGRSIPNISWSISDEDVVGIAAIRERVIKRWNQIANGIPKLVPRENSHSSQKPHDAYHPVGVCHMGTQLNSVVDLELKVRGLSNVWAVTTGVFPSAGTANPTFSMLCLGQHLVDQLASAERA